LKEEEMKIKTNVKAGSKKLFVGGLSFDTTDGSQ
jgi:hypothetical protein